jgi:H+/Cl- antiporter ClcA
MAVVGLKNLCTPAYVYFVISVIALIVMGFQNMGNLNTYCLGSYSCDVTSVTLIFLVKIAYVLLWTWILNLICRAGVPELAWFLVLLPFVLLFILIGLMMIPMEYQY